MRETRSKKSPKASSSSSLSSSERRNWGNIFNLLVQMVRNQQNQLHSLATQHKFLEERLRMQHHAWASDIRLHNDHISQMKGILKYEEKKRMLEAAQADLALGYKHREASIIKWILENTEDELADFKAWFEILSHKSSNGEDQGTALKDPDKRKKRNIYSENKSTRNNTEEEHSSSKIKDELRKLKEECEKLALEKSSEVSAILAEKKFVWNQYNIMEKGYTDKLRAKQAEVEKADEKIRTLVSSTEQLQSENDKKDSTISQLVSKVANMEAETERLNQEISRLSGELESLRRKSRKDQVTPVLNRCKERTKTSDQGTSKSGRKRDVAVKKEISTPDEAPAPANVSGKGNTSLKRKQAPVVLISETPKLFSSSFKVPKLKPSLRV